MILVHPFKRPGRKGKMWTLIQRGEKEWREIMLEGRNSSRVCGKQPGRKKERKERKWATDERSS